MTNNRVNEAQTKVTSMLGWKSSSWFYPKPTGDPGRDRNARTVQFACLLLASAVSTVTILNVIARELGETPLLVFAVAGLVAAMIMNRVGRWEWAARTAFLAVLLTAMLMVFEARDGFRSLAMLLFPGMLLLSVLLLGRASYMITSGIVLVAVSAMGMAEKQGLTRAIPGVRSSTTYESIFFVDLSLLVFAVIGSRIARDAQSNVFELRATIDRVTETNLELSDTAEALRESEQQLVSIYNTVRDVIFHLAIEPESQFRFVSVNAAFLRLTGLRREAVVGKTVREVIPEPSLTMALRKYRQAIEENTTVLWEETSDYPTGRLTGEVTVVPVFDHKGTCTHLVGSVHDITERKRAEAALRESEERLKHAERLAHVGNWRWDPHSNEVGWSEEMFDIFGQPQNYTPTYEAVLQAVTPQHKELVQRVFADSVAEKRGFNIELQIVRPNGDLRTITCIGEVLPDGASKPGSFLGACQDITETRRAQVADFARQKLESVGTLAGGIAHDFNNLLGGVLAQAELALRELAPRSSPEPELKAIQGLALRGSEIVRELMVYAGKESPAVGPVDVSRIVQEMLELLKVSVSKHAVLETSLRDDLPAVHVDPAQIRQIVMNLITNASEAIGDRDGAIRLTTSYVKADRILPGEISDHFADGGYVQLEVSDTGRGMPPEIQAKVFDPFFTTKSAGHGLGLAVVHGIVRGLSGQIHLVSNPGKGTAFQILLPCDGRPQEASRHPISPSQETAGLSRHATMLVVEDEDMLRHATATMLRRSGFEVFEAGNGSAAIDLLRATGSKIDLLLLDMTIPGSTSREVIAEYSRTRPDSKVILTSAYSEEMARATISMPQIRGFIRKPFLLKDLLKTLRNTLSA
jgi:PAS domain S-box-containing protein